MQTIWRGSSRTTHTRKRSEDIVLGKQTWTLDQGLAVQGKTRFPVFALRNWKHLWSAPGVVQSQIRGWDRSLLGLTDCCHNHFGGSLLYCWIQTTDRTHQAGSEPDASQLPCRGKPLILNGMTHHTRGRPEIRKIYKNTLWKYKNRMKRWHTWIQRKENIR